MIILNNQKNVRNIFDVVEFVLVNGMKNESRIGEVTEIMGATLTVDPQELLSRRGMSRTLGIVEALQFISGYFDERHILKAAPKLLYPYGIENAYGQKVSQQLPRVIDQLTRFPDTRRCILHIGKAEDGAEETKPCMQSVQFQIRRRRLFTTVFARSWDAIHGLPYDVVMFNLVSQVVAKLVGVGLGNTKFMASNLHVYKTALDAEKGKQRWESTANMSPKTLKLTADFLDFQDAREWAMDNLNRMDDWFLGMPQGVVYYE